jgi:hypothetical protein
MSIVERPHFPEYERSGEAIFPLDADLIQRRMAAFDASSEEFLEFATKARGEWGQATSLYTNIYGYIDTIATSHETAGDFEINAELYYRAGLLYGMDIAKMTRLMRYPYANKLIADNFEAFSRAVEYLATTMEPTDGDDKQYAREQHYTGSHILADTAKEQYELFAKRIGSIDAANDISALHAGMVDGAIFVAAYDAYSHGHEPQTFPEV